MDIRDNAGLWCDDITFCQEDCDWKDCPRNAKNIRDKTVPHSYSVEIPSDCPKKAQEAVEPKQVGLCGKDDWWGFVCVCPDCEAEWMSDRADTHFCPKCGRPVKWE